MPTALLRPSAARAVSWKRAVTSRVTQVAYTSVLGAPTVPRAHLDGLKHVTVLVLATVLALVVLTQVAKVASFASTEAALASSALVAVGEDGAVIAFESNVTNAGAIVGASTLATAPIGAQRCLATCASPSRVAKACCVCLADTVLRAVVGTRKPAAIAALPTY